MPVAGTGSGPMGSPAGDAAPFDHEQRPARQAATATLKTALVANPRVQRCTDMARVAVSCLLLVGVAGCNAPQTTARPPVPTTVAPSVGLPTAIPTATSAPTPPVATPTQGPPPPSFAAIDLAFFSTGQGWIVGADCPPSTPGCTIAVRLSHDGGRSYERVSPIIGTLSSGADGLPRLHVSFADSRTGWVTGLPRLLRSVDGGHSWHDDGLALATDLTPVGSSVWALANGRLYTSTDSGGSWHPTGMNVAPPPRFPSQPADLVRLSSQDGFAVDAPVSPTGLASMLVTRDGWRSWVRHALGCRSGGDPPAVAAIVLSRIWVACPGGASAGNQGKEIDLSTDGGVTWQTRATSEYRFNENEAPVAAAMGDLGTSGYVGALSVRQDGRLFLTLNRRAVLESVDGTTWTLVPGLPDEGVDGLRVDFVDTRRGWTIVGYSNPGSLWSTSDGGSDWSDLGAA